MSTQYPAGVRGWFVSLFRVWRREFRLVFSDVGVMLFFFALPLAYPVVYTLIYNPEIVRDIPIVVVDQCRTASSREFTRMIDATDAIKVYEYAPTVDAGRRILNSHDAYGLLLIPEDFDRCIGRGEQGHTTFFSDMSLLLRYRAFVSALTDVQMAYGAEIQSQTLNRLGEIGSVVGGTPITQEAIMIGDPTQGFASFVIPGIIVLILQQSLILGVCMLAGTSAERRRLNGGIDPLTVPAPPSASIMGKLLCWIACYIPMVLYILHLIPEMFSLPHVGNIWEQLVFIFPMLIASGCLGVALSSFVTERESSLMVVVFTSVFFLFLSGLTWPRYAMNGFWQLVGDCVPATWGLEGFIRMNSNGASLAQESHCYIMMWVLSAVYFILAYILTRYREAPGLRKARLLGQ